MATKWATIPSHGGHGMSHGPWTVHGPRPKKLEELLRQLGCQQHVVYNKQINKEANTIDVI